LYLLSERFYPLINLVVWTALSWFCFRPSRRSSIRPWQCSFRMRRERLLAELRRIALAALHVAGEASPLSGAISNEKA
jgi:hypothetical protein